RGFSLASRPADDVAHSEHALAKLERRGTAPHVGPETDPVGVHVPGAERAGARAHAVRMRTSAVPRRDVPWHDAVGLEAAPGEVAVRAFARVAQDVACSVESLTPPQADAL